MISTADPADTRSRISYAGTGRLKVYATAGPDQVCQLPAVRGEPV